MNRLKEVHKYGQSIWLDYIERDMLVSGELKGMIEEDGVRGVTSNPSIFEKAINGSHDYDEAEDAVRRLQELGVDLNDVTERLQRDGVAAFADSYDTLLASLEEKARTSRKAGKSGSE